MTLVYDEVASFTEADARAITEWRVGVLVAFIVAVSR